MGKKFNRNDVYLTGRNTFTKVFHSETSIMYYEADNEVLVLRIRKFEDAYFVEFEIL